MFLVRRAPSALLTSALRFGVLPCDSVLISYINTYIYIYLYTFPRLVPN